MTASGDGNTGGGEASGLPSFSGARQPLAIISGGSSGIGLAVARLLGRKGCRVALLARGGGRLSEAADLLRAEKIRVSTHRVDVTRPDETMTLVSALCAEAGAPSWVVTCAGIVEPGFFLEQDVALTAAQLQTNLLGTIHVVRAAAPAMVAAGKGRIVMVSSASGLFGVAGYAGYCASKFAVRGFAEALRIELAGAGVSVTVAAPPDTDTPQLAYEGPLRPAAIAGFAGGGGALSAKAVAEHMIRTAERGGFLSAPTTTLAVVARVQSCISGIFARVQMRLLRRASAR